MATSKLLIYCRFSSDMQNPQSCADQEREIRKALSRFGIDPKRAEVIHDEAVSGRKLDRQGYQTILTRLKNGEKLVIAVDDQSRLTRQDNAMAVITDIVFHGGRFISTAEGIDTQNEGWKLKARVMQMHHSMSSEETGKRIGRGHRGRILSGYSVGDLVYGFESFYEDPNAAINYTGRGPKPPKLLRINDEQAKWVRWIFQRFIDGRSPKQIADELTRLGAPKGSRSRTKAWTRWQVRAILANEKYIGIWRWGKKRVVQNSEGRKRQVPSLPNDVITVEHPELRIVPQPLWEAVQRRLAEVHEIWGHKPGQKKRGPKVHHTESYPKNVLLQLLECGHCGSVMHSNANQDGEYRRCKNSGNGPGLCGARNRIRSDAVKKVLYEFVARTLRSAPEWVSNVAEALRAELKNIEEKSNGRATAHQEQIDAIRSKQSNLLDLAEKAAINSDVLAARLADLDEKLSEETRLLEEAQLLEKAHFEMPSREWINEQLIDLAKLLESDEELAARTLPKLLTKVKVTSVRLYGKERGYHTLSFQFNCWGVLRSLLPEEARCDLIDTFAEGAELKDMLSPVVELNVGGPTALDQIVPEVGRLRAQGLTWKAIGERLGISLSKAHTAGQQFLRSQTNENI